MSTLAQQISDGIKDAMWAKDSTALTALRALKTAIMNATIEKSGAGGELPDADQLAVVRKQLKQRQDAIESFVSGGREDLAEKERAEVAILEKFLPAQLSAAEVDALVDGVIAETGATGKAQMGAVMKLVQERAAGRADGKALSQAVAKRLS